MEPFQTLGLIRDTASSGGIAGGDENGPAGNTAVLACRNELSDAASSGGFAEGDENEPAVHTAVLASWNNVSGVASLGGIAGGDANTSAVSTAVLVARTGFLGVPAPVRCGTATEPSENIGLRRPVFIEETFQAHCA